MGLDMYLQIRPSINLNVVREIITHNRKAYRYTHARKARNHDFKSYAKFIASTKDSFYEERELFEPLLHLSPLFTNAFIRGKDAQRGELNMPVGNPGQAYDLREVYDELQEELQAYLDASENVPPLLSHQAKQFLLLHPDYEERWHVELPSFSSPKEKEQMEKYDVYWRNAPHLHKWFVDYVQDGEDDENFYTVHRDQLIRLKLVLTDVLELYAENADNDGIVPQEVGEKITRLLPLPDASRFSTAAYDHSYYKHVQQTMHAITYAINNVDFDSYSFVYTSSY